MSINTKNIYLKTNLDLVDVIILKGANVGERSTDQNTNEMKSQIEKKCELILEKNIFTSFEPSSKQLQSNSFSSLLTIFLIRTSDAAYDSQRITR